MSHKDDSNYVSVGSSIGFEIAPVLWFAPGWKTGPLDWIYIEQSPGPYQARGINQEEGFVANG
jgi:hypothetical protein